MDLLLRVTDGAGDPRDLQLSVSDSATIGDLADHLSRLLGLGDGLTIGGYCREDLISVRCPRSGSTVHLTDRTPDEAAPLPAPVEICFPPDSAGVHRGPVAVYYGSNDIDGVCIHVDDQIEVRSLGGTTPLVNGQRVMGSRRLRSGDFVAVSPPEGRSRGFSVQVRGSLTPPPGDGAMVSHRLTRRLPTETALVRVDLPTPPEPIRLPGFPVLSAVVPLLMGAGLWLATRSAASSVFIIFSFVYVVAAGLEARHESRREDRFRVQQFRRELEEARSRIEDAQALEYEARNHECPPVGALQRIVHDRSERLWERPLDEDPQSFSRSALAVRIGVAFTESQILATGPRSGRPDLRDEACSVAKEAGRAELPVIVDLDLGGGLALIGNGETTTEVARWVVAQLAALVAPDDLRIIVLSDPLRASAWSWCRWLPHLQRTAPTQRTLIVVDGADDDEVKAALSLLPEGSARFLWLGATRAAMPGQIRQVLDLNVEPQLHAITQTAPGRSDIAPVGGLEVAPRKVAVDRLQLEDMTEDQVLPLARRLSPVIPVRSALDDHSHSEFGAEVPIQAILDDPDAISSSDAILKLWRASEVNGSLRAPVGRAGHGTVHLDLVDDGPHALVAGTTGSGKSEFLRSLVVSLALHNSPRKLTFLLVDYKGGAAFNSLERLPHTVGLITDLSAELAERALTSLRAEVKRRERILAAIGLTDLNDAHGDSSGDLNGRVPPSLAVVVDEFATLARELPGFVDGLVDVAQRGRSLGIHLLLATQRPAGVVTESIKANTSLRIALRVADPEDSTDVVDTAEAASLPRSAAGRGLVRFGSAPPVHVQFAYSGGAVLRREPVASAELGCGPVVSQLRCGGLASHIGVESEPSGSTQLDQAVASVIEAALSSGCPSPRRPWQHPLPDVVGGSEIQLYVSPPPKAPPSTGMLPVGLVDRPSQQRIDPLFIDFGSCGGVLVLGASGSGRSTALATIASSGGMDAYLIGARPSPPLESDSDVFSDVIDPNDLERSLRLLRGAAAKLRRPERSLGRSDRGMLILIDDFASFEEAHQNVNRGEALDLLARIAREGRSQSVHLAIAASRRVEVPGGLTSNLGMHIALRLPSEDEASLLGLGPEAAAATLPPGRGYVGRELVQIALSDSSVDNCRSSCGSKVASLPHRIRIADLTRKTPPDPDRRGIVEVVPIGINIDDLSVAEVDMKRSHLIVAGPRRSGRSSALDLLANSVQSSVSSIGRRRRDLISGAVVMDLPAPAASTFLLADTLGGESDSWTARFTLDPSEIPAEGRSDNFGPVEPWTENVGCDGLEEFLRRVRASATAGLFTLLAVDDLPELLESPLEARLESELAELLALSRTTPLRIVLSGEIDALTRCYSSALGRVRSERSAILIQPDPDVHGSLVHCDLPRRDEIQPGPGRGWLVQDGRQVPVQLAAAWESG